MHRLLAVGLSLAIAGLGAAPAAEEQRATDPKYLAMTRDWFNPDAFVRPEDQEKARRLRDGYPSPFPCAYEKVELGIGVIASLPTDHCFKMTSPHRMHGLWRNNFEGQEFCAAPANLCPSGDGTRVAWIDVRSLPGLEDTPPGGLYAIDFVGRSTAYPGHYGGYGFYNREVIGTDCSR
jgi:hypothetical protein